MHMVRHGFLYAGRMAELTSKRHSALVYVALTEREFTVETPRGRQHASAMLVAPGVQRRFLSGQVPLACLDIAPTHRYFRVFAQARGEVEVWPRSHFDAVMTSLPEFLDGRMGLPDADRLYERIAARAVECLPPLKPIDPRVRQVMCLLRENRHYTLDELADAVCISKDWLVHLFQREAGISMRKFEQTLKLQTAASYVNCGVSMTEVAANAGFADLAHFSKMWKQHYGFPPRHMFASRGLVTIDPLPEPRVARIA
jgi:AraC-like DNA-binding protein